MDQTGKLNSTADSIGMGTGQHRIRNWTQLDYIEDVTVELD